MGVLKALFSLVASLGSLLAFLAIGGILAFIGYFAGAILLGIVIVGVVACGIHEILFNKHEDV